jgi:hypothetical protein
LANSITIVVVAIEFVAVTKPIAFIINLAKKDLYYDLTQQIQQFKVAHCFYLVNFPMI